jgi:predicted P-loop ATPase
VLFDARANASVEAARRQFAQFLCTHGATVVHAHLPDDDKRVNGPDDLIGVQGDAAFWRVLDAAIPHDFVRDRHQRVIASSLDNIRLALAKLQVQPMFDAFARELRLDGAALDDTGLERIWVRIDDRFHWRPSRDTLRTVITTEAHEAPVHPVRQYLDGLVWDGTPRLDTWLTTYAGASDTAYVRAVGALPLIAAVRRVRHPGCKFDELLILESPQGTLKSTALRTLCPNEDWFSDDLPLGVESKQVIERTAGKWVVEAAELHGNRGREAEALKAFLSRQVDGPVRLAYARIPVSVPRQFIIIGTTNSRLAYLKDMTGARRFWPVTVGRFDVESLARDRDQLWAEAATSEANGASIRLDPALWEAAAAEQEERRAADPWEPILEPLLDGDGITRVEHVAVSAIWAALKLEANHLVNQHADRVTAIVQRHGFVRKHRIRVAGKPELCWIRDGEEPYRV